MARRQWRFTVERELSRISAGSGLVRGRKNEGEFYEIDTDRSFACSIAWAWGTGPRILRWI